MDLHYIIENFKSESDFETYLLNLRWKAGVTCPACSSKKVYRKKKERRFICGDCNRSFSVTAGTVLHGTKLPLSKWFLAASVIASAKKGLSSLQLARTIGVNADTAWYIQRRLRHAMWQDFFLKGLVEIDETYVGGSLSNKHYYKKKKAKSFHKQGMAHKTAVLGMVQRGGKIMVRVLEHASGEHIKPILHKTIDKSSTIITDGFGGYYGMNEHVEKHVKLNHARHIRNQGAFNLSSIEGFWTMVKRAIIGQYHKVSPEYLQDYMNEISFKRNNRRNVFFTLLEAAVNGQLPFDG